MRIHGCIYIVKRYLNLFLDGGRDLGYLYIVGANKEVLVTVRISENVRNEFKIAAELRGATMSGLLHQFIVRTIREEKEAAPHDFRVRKVKSLAASASKPQKKRRTG